MLILLIDLDTEKVVHTFDYYDIESRMQSGASLRV